MDSVFRDFQRAHLGRSGPLLATTITPIAPPEDLNRLRRTFSVSNAFTIQQEIRSGLLAHTNTELRFSKPEGNAWVEVYVAYWKAVGEIIALEENLKSGWAGVYEAWKEVANAVIRGYSNGGFESWTIPCLYVTGRFLRIFAIKTDEQLRERNGGDFNAGMQDDIAGELGKNEKLEDAARIINRIFTLCISDRYAAYLRCNTYIKFKPVLKGYPRAPIGESRKWGLYYTTNLLFKTYFKVISTFVFIDNGSSCTGQLNSIGLSKNILRALQASSADMPPIESFPMSHVVTFKYYVGVILFLEENYVKVGHNAHI